MQVKVLRDLLNRLLSLERFQRNTGFKSGVMSFSFGFHEWGSGFVVKSAPVQPNHSLAPGPVFGVHPRGDAILPDFCLDCGEELFGFPVSFLEALGLEVFFSKSSCPEAKAALGVMALRSSRL